MYGSPWNCRNSRPFHHRPWRKFAADALVGCHLTLVSSLYLSPLWREPHGSRSLVAWRTCFFFQSTWQGIQLKVPLLFGKILGCFKTPNCGHVVTWPFWPASLYISLESWIDSGGLNHELQVGCPIVAQMVNSVEEWRNGAAVEKTREKSLCHSSILIKKFGSMAGTFVGVCVETATDVREF